MPSYRFHVDGILNLTATHNNLGAAINAARQQFSMNPTILLIEIKDVSGKTLWSLQRSV